MTPSGDPRAPARPDPPSPYIQAMEAREVALVAFGGTGAVTGLNALTEGGTDAAALPAALARARAAGFRGA